MTTTEFLLRLGVAFLCGAAIGIERQWRQRTAGLRTYTLVAAGSALFVMVAVMTPEEVSPTRVAAQVVTGIGFLGAGVIMRSGVNVRGLNTAATIWCSLAVGQSQDHAVLKAVLSSAERTDAALQQIASRLSVERSVVGLSWQLLLNGRDE